MSEWTLEDRFWNRKHTLECFIMKCTYSNPSPIRPEYHYTAYIALPEGHRHHGREGEKIRIDVHGGFTYARDYLIMGDNGEEIKDGRWFIGWDYAHAWDENVPFRRVLFDCLDAMKKLGRGMK